MLFSDIQRVQTSVMLKFYGPVMCQNRPDVGNIIPINYQITGRLCHILQPTPCEYSLYWYFKICQLKMYCECYNTQSFITLKWEQILQTRSHIMNKSHHNNVLHVFCPMFKKKMFFQKLAGLWLVGEVVNHVGLYPSKVAEGCSVFQRRACYIRYWFHCK